MHTRDRIARAAARLFAEQGFMRTSIRQIAERASANSALIYYYFGSKEGLLEWLVERMQSRVRANLERATSHEGGPAERLEHFIRLQVRLIRRRAPVARLFVREILSSNPVMLSAVRSALQPNLRLVQSLIEEGIAAGELRAVDAELAARTLVGSIMVPVALAPLVDGAQRSSAELEDHVVDLYMRGLKP